MQAYETYEIEADGMRFRVEYHYDADMAEPWKAHDGHGVVSEWTSRDKSPSERVMNHDGEMYRYYDVAESVQIALRDNWGDGLDADTRTKGEIAASAVEKDYQHLRAWCQGVWHWCGVLVTLLDIDGNATNETESLWGIESDSGNYLRETALELAGEIIARVPADGKLTVTVRKAEVQS